jgi:hypothetical protein
MLSWNRGVSFAARVSIAAGLVLGVAQVASADIYAWRTEDGGYAYTDNKDHIPARYRAQAKAIGDRSLSTYKRFTPQDSEAGARYAEKLTQRLQALRAANAQSAQASRAVAAASGAAPATGTLLVSTGSGNAPQIQVPMATDGSPLVVEPVLSKRTGDSRTRRTTLVKQGDHTVAVILGPPHNFDPVDGIVNEGEVIEPSN